MIICPGWKPFVRSSRSANPVRGISAWLNTPGGESIDLDDLRGRVVLVDFWAYSCINCQRSIPHVVAWDEAYRDAGLTVIGVHSPEYAFEKEARNVAAGADAFGIEYPVALDYSLSTWTNYRNRYWPAHYLIDADGTVRHVAFGEGHYDRTERLIRELLRSADPAVALPEPTDVADETPDAGALTAETFLGTTKQVTFAGDEPYRRSTSTFALPEAQPADSFALEGEWSLETQSIAPVADGAIRLRYTAAEVRMVLSGTGTIVVHEGGGTRRIDVGGVPRSYVVHDGSDVGDGELVVEVPTGVTAYSFTFG
ncbi:redoxin domain-containing protein [Agromyces sp. SYSU T00266]|uniref:redoxin domain-containing protein n=1 Tax=Agromyces zhanjiangensis TaxID=3158562 RepID=UPI0033997B64